ncbi:MAG: carboxypeptidase-like regulatory domain-containing protein [Bacteroidales bacterium]|nr:carboxypeptidase-like regulatory domain-containing protein [Bacteroidales bacterium]
MFLLLCMAIAGFSQTQTIRGCITDKVTKYPLIGANIVVLNSSPLLGAATDTSGNFKLSDVPVGFISLKISYM